MIIARCKEKSYIAAVCNGHQDVFPEAEVIFKDDWAFFYKKGKKVFSCNEDYAREHFEIINKQVKS